MTSRDFAFWLQGFFEVGFNHVPKQDRSMTPSQIEMIEKHLSLVFIHEIDPSMGDQDHQAELNKAHDIGKPTLQELGEKHNFDVHEPDYKHGTQPFPGWVCSPLHGWYDPEQGTPRC